MKFEHDPYQSDQEDLTVLSDINKEQTEQDEYPYQAGESRRDTVVRFSSSIPIGRDENGKVIFMTGESK